MAKSPSVKDVSRALLIVGVAFVTGCSTTNAQRVLSAEKATYKNLGMSPELDVESTVDVGETVAEQFEYDVYVDAKTVDVFEGKRGLGKISVPAGETLTGLRARDGSTEYCSTRNLYLDPMTGPYDVVCLADTNNDLKFDKIRVPAIMLGKWIEASPPVRYDLIPLDIPVDLGRGYKMELIYQGLSDGDIKIAYREYIDNMARPAFSQIVEYEYSSGETTIAFKGARITIHEATSNTLKYTLEKGFTR